MIQTMQFIINISYYLQQQGIRQCSLSSIFPIIYNNKASDNAVYHQYFLLLIFLGRLIRLKSLSAYLGDTVSVISGEIMMFSLLRKIMYTDC